MNTITLSTDGTFTYYLTKSTKEQCESLSILKDDEVNKEIRKIVKNPNAISILEDNGMKLVSGRIEPILQRIKGGQFRCYDMPLKQQEDNAYLVNVSPCTKTCWQSALRKVGYKQASGLNTPAYYEAYILIWKVKN